MENLIKLIAVVSVLVIILDSISKFFLKKTWRRGLNHAIIKVEEDLILCNKAKTFEEYIIYSQSLLMSERYFYIA